MSAFTHPALSEVDAVGAVIENVGVALDCHPTDWAPLWDHDILRAITLMEVPEPYNPMPNCGGVFGDKPVDYATQMAVAERIARFDANVVLALPTPTMSGYAIHVLGNTSQVESYFSRYLNPNPGRSFFGITEPSVGSDATAGKSAIVASDGGRCMTVHKKLVGGAKQANAGLLFVWDAVARAHKMVMCGPDIISQLQIDRLPMHGLTGADLTEIRCENLEIPEEAILGHGRTAGLRDGFFAMNSVFERYRPIVATLAIGSARGILDTLSDLGISKTVLDPLFVRHAVFLQRLQKIADTYETGTSKVYDTSRLKLDAVAFLDETVATVFRTVPSADLFQHPSLLKKCRDAKSYEYMEGTSHIHLLQSFRSYVPASA